MKKLIVEIADKYADAASMTFIGTNCAESEEIHMTVAAVALKPDITAIRHRMAKIKAQIKKKF